MSKKILHRFACFCAVGGLNTAIDIFLFNLFLFVRPTQSTLALLAYNSLAYAFGATNSFCWNKWWTFREKKRVTVQQLVRFTLVTTLGIGCNDFFLWLSSSLLATLHITGFFWTNLAKIAAIGGSFLVSYLGMHFAVFCQKSGEGVMSKGNRPRISYAPRGLSVVLPAYNEEQSIAHTINSIIKTLDLWHLDFEIIVIDDGSTDKTAAVVDHFMTKDFRVRLYWHEKNKGYGDALKSGFALANKELTFFMDSDGQFDIEDLSYFLPLIEEYGAVFGYRIDRQDSRLRKFNAWAWEKLVCFLFGVRVRDIDCAFKLFRTHLLQQIRLESGGAMINAELIYKLSRAGCLYTQVGVVHLPRTAGKATGAQFSVILHALGQIFYFAEKWRKEEMQEEELRRLSFLKN